MSELKVHASACNAEPMVQDEEIRRAFVKRLKNALSAANMAEWGAGTRLARIAGTTDKAASKWMNGEAMPGRKNMLAIARALGVRVEWLQYGEGPDRANVNEDIQAKEGGLTYSSESTTTARLLLSRATPKTQKLLQEIIASAEQGQLSEADAQLLHEMYKRIIKK